MKRSLPVALVVGFVFGIGIGMGPLVLPAMGQRGGGARGGGVSGGSASHGGAPGFSGSRGFSGAPRYGATGATRPGLISGYGQRMSGSANLRPVYPGTSPAYDHYRPPYRQPYRQPYGAAIPYGYVGWNGWVIPGPLDDAEPVGPDAAGLDTSLVNPNGGDDSGSLPPPWTGDPNGPAGPPPSASAYRPSYQQAPPPAPIAPESEEAVTIVFKDGRPPEQIRNYILTQTTLLVRDQHRHDIPLDQIDASATERANRQAGVSFQLPASPR